MLTQEGFDLWADDYDKTVGGIAFETREKLNRCRLKAGDAWDDEEICFAFNELRNLFPALKFEQVSFCAGILTLSR